MNGGLNYKDPKVKAALVVLQVILLFAEKLLIEQSAAEKKDIFFVSAQRLNVREFTSNLVNLRYSPISCENMS
ncbi:MAG: hypothetical protein EOP33_05965 [Rickettsiaceae bacterium]|nr:MAG: hypothetical protein EOP33_05965 [Rickettsiaceae bacterium]